MGPQRVLQAAVCGLIAAIAGATAHAKPRERVAVIELGPADSGAARRAIAGAAVSAGLEVAAGDGLEDALAGEVIEKDAVLLAAALAEAQRAFGALDCAAAATAARTAIGLGAARQAAGLAVPELPRAWTYVLECADRTNDTAAALHAAAMLRAVIAADAAGTTASSTRGGGSDLLAKYPDVDTTLDRDQYALEITTDVPGAEVWIDFRRAGTSPVKTFLGAGEHVIAAARGTRRGWAAGTAQKAQKTLAVPLTDHASPHAALAAKIAAWKGSPAEIAAVLEATNARVALIRTGDNVEVWGRSGKAEVPRRLGGEDGVGTLAEAPRLAALIADRAQTWNDRAPDPDQPLLV
ncbi:MAG: hypothetical protein JNL83_40240, partial [Myxococcales bacterium]|nr:hypothetical protein [Myxococcales bacterium]